MTARRKKIAQNVQSISSQGAGSRMVFVHVGCLLVVKVVFVVFPNSAGLIGNSTNPITRFSG